MLIFILTEVIVLLVIFFLLLILSAVWPPDSPWAPWWQMPENVIQKMCKMARISAKDVIYDLGCGTGKALILAATSYGAKGVGIEIDPVRFWIASWNVHSSLRAKPDTRWHLAKRNNLIENKRLPQSLRSFAMTKGQLDITFLKKNFFTVDLAPATVIFVYLVPAALKRLVPKFLKELRPGTKFLSYVYPMPEELFKGKLKLIKHDKESKIFYYQLLAEAKQ